MKLIKSKKFALRQFKKGDEESLAGNINDKAIYRYTAGIPHPYSLSDAKKWVRHCIEDYNEKSEINFAIDINGDVVGSITLIKIEGHRAEIGYWLAKGYWNKGIMTEAVRLITDFCFKKLKLQRIYAPVFCVNKASANVLENNHYVLEGIMKKYYLKDGEFYDALMYAKTIQ